MTLREIGSWFASLPQTFYHTVNEVPFLDWHIWVVLVYGILVVVGFLTVIGVPNIAAQESSKWHWYYLNYLVPPAFILGVTLYIVPGESWAWLLLILGLFVANIIWIFVTVVKVLFPYPGNDQDKNTDPQ